MRRDALIRLLPFAAVCAAAAIALRPSWMGLSLGDVRVQLDVLDAAKLRLDRVDLVTDTNDVALQLAP